MDASHRLTFTLLFLPLLLGLPKALAAQATGPELTVGERVRADYGVYVDFTGTLLEQDERWLSVQPDDSTAAPRLIPLADIQRLEAWRCCDRANGFVRGAFLGAGLALAGGFILSTAPTDPGTGANMAMAGAVIVGVPAGILVGGLVGRQAWSPHTWVEVPTPNP